VIFEERREPPARNVAVLVDRGRQYCAPVLTVPNGIICTSSKKGNAEWRAGDDHSSNPSSRI
jgi:hypothetical protein